jgi:hypothetical protein
VEGPGIAYIMAGLMVGVPEAGRRRCKEMGIKGRKVSPPPRVLQSILTFCMQRYRTYIYIYKVYRVVTLQWRRHLTRSLPPWWPRADRVCLSLLFLCLRSATRKKPSRKPTRSVERKILLSRKASTRCWPGQKLIGRRTRAGPTCQSRGSGR